MTISTVVEVEKKESEIPDPLMILRGRAGNTYTTAYWLVRSHLFINFSFGNIIT